MPCKMIYLLLKTSRNKDNQRNNSDYYTLAGSHFESLKSVQQFRGKNSCPITPNKGTLRQNIPAAPGISSETGPYFIAKGRQIMQARLFYLSATLQTSSHNYREVLL